jgi:hypothetical protein
MNLNEIVYVEEVINYPKNETETPQCDRQPISKYVYLVLSCTIVVVSSLCYGYNIGLANFTFEV